MQNDADLAAPRTRRFLAPRVTRIPAAQLSVLDGGWTHGHVTGDVDALGELLPDDCAWLVSGSAGAERLDLGPVLIATMQEIEPGSGYPMHAHHGIDTVTIMLSGSYVHEAGDQRDTVGPDDVAVVSAGCGIAHQETTLSGARLKNVMFWVRSNAPGGAPRVGTRTFARQDRVGRLVTVASGRGAEGALPLCAELDIATSILPPGRELRHAITGRGYLIVASGMVIVDDVVVSAGDRVVIDGAGVVTIAALSSAELVLVTC